MQRIISIVGPTASGKTAMAVKLAQLVDGEVVSVDSMQIYRGMDIGTAKPDKEEMEGVVHHMIDVADPDENYSLERFATRAHEIIKDIGARGKVPILAGGTGLYMDTIVNNISLSQDSFDPRIREELMAEAEREGKEKMYEMLKEIDPEAAKKLHPNDVKRVIRALEIYRATGITKTEQDKKSKNTEKIYDCLSFGLYMDRKILYNRINMRVDLMVEKGLIDEVASLDIKGTSLQGVGYKEILYYLNGLATKDEALSILKKETRHLAKRQMTWFSKNDSIMWLDATKPAEELAEIAKREFYRE
ncbi:MAG: tRNA (adenosine(37)-N6)-dimethylallyltransferase MiaA [Clostridia bacterium]|nr:tRNA (adenosine(37)-N6)-dimethylallyltransferase MiaA [Clostridia bacterium]